MPDGRMHIGAPSDCLNTQSAQIVHNPTDLTEKYNLLSSARLDETRVLISFGLCSALGLVGFAGLSRNFKFCSLDAQWGYGYTGANILELSNI